MPEPVPAELEHARILVTNDDGIHSPGLAVLEEVAREVSHDVWVVAPEAEQSATSHSLTMRRPLRERRLDARHYTVDGTPTDCVLIAHHQILGDRKPDFVLSGINLGANLGEDVTYSGTVAAAMEGAMLGIRAIAFSQMRDDEGELDWATARRFAPDILRRLANRGWDRDLLVNVNFPALQPEDVQGIRVCRQGRRDQGTTVHEVRDPAGRKYVWIGSFASDITKDMDTDLAVVAQGMVSVTPLHLDMTHHATLQRLTGAFA